ncbi:hypothetical protein LN042_09585 [Kitasatospora sp. RB6PN24]|uniref:hypothetical protein n=1 Tax=Kitasatospora humi TaxID=2893891 RepID=UPI001E52B5DB|nr:hypothetical protein [Kitasatospora humi]MCC9307351.1 hypothetical protein [Kitasatospora humi]
MLVEIHLDQHFLLSGGERQNQSQSAIELRPFGGLDDVQDADQAAVAAGQGRDVVAGEPG